MKILIASKNLHKIREMKFILKSQLLNVDILSLLDFPDYVAPQEGGSSFKENAMLKVKDAAKKFNLYSISDDSGLVVPKLNGAPGVLSARFAGKNASFKENRKKLLSEMKNLTDEDRNAYFECWVALASPSGEVKKCTSGICEGKITESEKGSDGFGYDSLFIKNEYNKTFAELNEDLKNKISHRRKALDKILPLLGKITQKA